MASRRRRADVPHRRQRRGRARRRGDRDRACQGQGRPEGPRRGRRRRRSSTARCAWSRPRSTRPRASAACASSSATTRPARRRASRAAPSRPRKSQGLAVPSSAVLYDADGAYVQVVRDGKVETPRRQDRPDRGAAWSRSAKGSSEGDLVVARAGTFLRDGDAVRAGACRDAEDQRGASNAPQHLGLVDPPAGAGAGAVHGADAARLRQLQPLPVTRFPNIDVPIVQVRVVPVRRRAVRARERRSPRRSRTPSPASTASSTSPRPSPRLVARRSSSSASRSTRTAPSTTSRTPSRHPRRAAAHHRGADRPAHRDRRPADPHLSRRPRRA